MCSFTSFASYVWPLIVSTLLSSVIALAYLVLFGSVVAFTAYSWLLGVAPVSKVATYAYVNPVVAVLLGALLVDEKVTVTSLGGGLLTLIAVQVVQLNLGLLFFNLLPVPPQRHPSA